MIDLRPSACEAPILLEGIHCRMAISRPAPGLVLLSISGSDIGEFGRVPFRVVMEQMRSAPCELFIDSRGTRGASIEVSQAWAEWLSDNRASLRRVTMLCGSRLIAVSARSVRRFAALGDLMRLTTDEAAFDLALAEARQGSPAWT